MAKGKKDSVFDELKATRLELAAYHGFVSRLHGHLRLPHAESVKEKLGMCRRWLSEVDLEKDDTSAVVPEIDEF